MADHPISKNDIDDWATAHLSVKWDLISCDRSSLNELPNSGDLP